MNLSRSEGAAIAKAPLPKAAGELPEGLALPHDAWAMLVACGAAGVPHSGRTLLAHLVGTYKLLAAWGRPDAVCLGGLFHSIYGTNALRHRSIRADRRPALSASIGVEAESLAWLFCALERPGAILQALRRGIPRESIVTAGRGGAGGSDSLRITPVQWCALAEIECANLVEQGSRSNALRSFYCLALEAPGVLSAPATTALRDCLRGQLAEPARPAVEVRS